MPGTTQEEPAVDNWNVTIDFTANFQALERTTNCFRRNTVFSSSTAWACTICVRWPSSFSLSWDRSEFRASRDYPPHSITWYSCCKCELTCEYCYAWLVLSLNIRVTKLHAITNHPHSTLRVTLHCGLSWTEHKNSLRCYWYSGSNVGFRVTSR